ncbi:MAG: hypothetical protein PHP74_04210 [Candidatus Gracilibacteria bacterium]|nr:hypothetical protein [Candidatus Gracilibacteria bacterium]
MSEKEFELFTPDSIVPKQRPLRKDRAYSMPYSEWQFRIAANGGQQAVIGGAFLKLRQIVETKPPLWKRWPRKNPYGEPHERIEKFMEAQQVLIDIYEQILELMREVYSPEKEREEMITEIRQKIADLNIPEILTANNLDPANATGELQFAFAGFNMGFLAEQVCGLSIREDKNSDFFLVDPQAKKDQSTTVDFPPAIHFPK